MRAMLVTVLLLLVVVALYQGLYGGDDGLLQIIEQREQKVSERVMRLNP